MSPEERQAALNNISPEDLAKIQNVQNKSIKIDQEDLLETEFALKFGWEAYREYKNDEIKTKEMMKLIIASRKIESLTQFRNAQAVLIGSGSAKSKSPSNTFKSLTAELLKSTEPDDE